MARSVTGMKPQRCYPIRFETGLTPAMHAELERLGKRLGTSPRDLARIAISRLLADRDVLTGGNRERFADAGLRG